MGSEVMVTVASPPCCWKKQELASNAKARQEGGRGGQPFRNNHQATLHKFIACLVIALWPCDVLVSGQLQLWEASLGFFASDIFCQENDILSNQNKVWRQWFGRHVWRTWATLLELLESVFPELDISSTGKVLDGQVQSLRQQVQEAGIGKGLVVIFEELETYWEDFSILYNSYYFIIFFWPTSPSWLHFASGQHLQAALGAAGSEGFLKSRFLSLVVLIRFGMSPAVSMVFLRFFFRVFIESEE